MNSKAPPASGELFVGFCHKSEFVTFKEPTGDYQAFINGEARYTRLAQSFPERAEELFQKAEATAKAKYERLKKLVDFYS